MIAFRNASNIHFEINRNTKGVMKSGLQNEFYIRTVNYKYEMCEMNGLAESCVCVFFFHTIDRAESECFALHQCFFLVFLSIFAPRINFHRSC